MSKIPLRAKYPEIYERLTEELESRGVHSFEVKADIINDEDGERLSIKFGSDFVHERVQKMNKSTGMHDGVLSEFLIKIAQACQAQAVEDYHGFMNIQPIKSRL